MKRSTSLLTIFLGVFVLLAPTTATPTPESIEIAQDSESSSVETMRAEAKRLMAEATQLYGQGTATSRQTAIVKFEKALDLWRDLGDLSGEATTLTNLGAVYSSIEQPEEALKHYKQAWTIFEKTGERSGEAITLINLGAVYSSIEQPEEALKHYKQALSIQREIGDRKTEVITLINIGDVYSNLGQPEKALTHFQQALPIYRETGDRHGEATTLINVGDIYSNLRQPEEALKYYKQALPIFKAIGNRHSEGNTLNDIGDVYYNLGQPKTALSYFEQSLPIRRKTSNLRGEGTTLANLGAVYLGIGQPKTALSYFEQALPIYRETGDLNNEAITFNNIGAVYINIGQSEQALNHYKQALPILRKLHDRKTEAATLNNIGAVYINIGQPKRALNHYEQALLIVKELRDRKTEAVTLGNVGEVYANFGQPEQALNHYKQALLIFKEIGNRNREAGILNSIGAVYSDLGQPEKALTYFEQVLPIFRETGDRNREATTLNNFGAVYAKIGQSEQALNHYKQALPIFKEIGDRQTEAITLRNVGDVYAKIGQPEQALNHYKQALPIHREIGDSRTEAYTLNSIGGVHYGIRQPEKALTYYNQALPIIKEIGDRFGEANTLRNIASLEKDQENLTEAFSNIQASIDILETIRGEITDSDFRTTYFASVNDYYQLYINILMELHQQNPNDGYHKQALEVSEQARARTLLELIEEGEIYRGIDPQLKKQKEELDRQIAAKTQAIEALAKSDNKTQVAQIETFKQERVLLENQLQALESKIRQQNPEYARLTQGKFNLNAQDIQQKVVNENTVLLSYWLGEEQSYLWLVTPNEITSYILPPKAEIEAVTAEIIGYAQDAGWVQYPKKATAANQKLSQMLLAPVADKITNKRIIVVADGGLQYLPFSLLENPQTNQLLITSSELVNLPSASTLDAIRSSKSDRSYSNSKEIAIFAHPIFTQDDDRLQGKIKSTSTEDTPETLAESIKREAIKGFNFRPLPGTEATAQQILAYVPNSNQTQIKLGFEANREAIFDPSINQYRLIHLGTHGFFNKDKPEYSGIVLSLYDEQGNYQVDGLLLLTEVFNLDLPADLVVLSACNTVGGKEVKGEGIVGLTRGLMYAGAERVIMTLWDIDDEPTGVFMDRFYQEILENKLTPAAALRATQLWMQTESDYPTPDYWAGFVLQGEWN